jgi:hypothetical protein
MRKKMISIALVSAIGLSASYAETVTVPTNTTNSGPAKHYNQIIQTVNLLVNPSATDTTASPVAIAYYAGDKLCWDSGVSPASKAIPYKNYDVFGSCPIGDNCGCHLMVTRVDIIPQPVTIKGQVMYETYSVDINTSPKITATQIMIYQDPASAPSFDPITGKVTPGKLQVVKQEQ